MRDEQNRDFYYNANKTDFAAAATALFITVFFHLGIFYALPDEFSHAKPDEKQEELQIEILPPKIENRKPEFIEANPFGNNDKPLNPNAPESFKDQRAADELPDPASKSKRPYVEGETKDSQKIVSGTSSETDNLSPNQVLQTLERPSNSPHSRRKRLHKNRLRRRPKTDSRNSRRKRPTRRKARTPRRRKNRRQKTQRTINRKPTKIRLPKKTNSGARKRRKTKTPFCGFRRREKTQATQTRRPAKRRRKNRRKNRKAMRRKRRRTAAAENRPTRERNNRPSRNSRNPPNSPSRNVRNSRNSFPPRSPAPCSACEFPPALSPTTASTQAPAGRWPATPNSANSARTSKECSRPYRANGICSRQNTIWERRWERRSS